MSARDNGSECSRPGVAGQVLREPALALDCKVVMEVGLGVVIDFTPELSTPETRFSHSWGNCDYAG